MTCTGAGGDIAAVEHTSTKQELQLLASSFVRECEVKDSNNNFMS